ncbi:carbohydrate binding domain-containing protein [Streptomyces sp. NPDC058700]|uniref:carbohydrate binding domain-containing protein n=1 Tax=Streptomyces sp. NPDC058700 TaxID=3346607 RepID=UPI0036680462
MTRVTVQAGFGYSPTATDITWTDLTRRVKLAGGGEISITRGASDELSETQTGTLTLELDNSDGHVTPGNAASPYYPNIRRNTPLRVITTVLGGINYLTQPGFEVDDASWTAPDGQEPHSAAVDTTHVKSGTYAHKIGWSATGTGGVLQCPLYGLTIGVPYTASVYVWVPAGDPAVRLDIDGTTVGAASTVTGTWQRISVTWTTTGASHTLRITTNTTSPVVGDAVWMDEGQVEEGSTPTAWSSAGATHHARFFGMVTSWPMGWEGLASEARITASDMLKWPTRRGSLGPMLVEEIQGDEARLYYPLSEPESSTTAGDQSGYGRPSMTIQQSSVGGTLEFGAGAGPPSDNLPAPLFTPASATAGKFLRGAISPMLTSSGSTGTPIAGDQAFECWFNTGTSGRVIMTWSSGAAAAFDSGIRFQLESGTGKLQVAEYLPVGTTTITVATPNLANSQPHHLIWDEAGHDVWVDGVQYAVATTTWQDRLVLTVGASETGTNLWLGTISHVAAYVRSGGFPAISELVEHYAAGMTGHEGELAWIRMYRLAGYARIPGVIPQGSFSAVASQGELGSSPLTHMRDIERTEGGKLIADRASAWLIFQARTIRYNPTPALTLAYADLETGEVEFADDDQKLVNRVTASRPGGATQRIQDAESIATYGIYEDQLDILKTTDQQVIDAATWQVIRYGDPQPEMRQLPVEASTLGTATYRALLDADVSTVATITSLPAQAMAPTVTVTVEGYTERITQAQHHLDFHVSRSDTDSVWVLDDPTYSVLGATTRLAY